MGSHVAAWGRVGSRGVAWGRVGLACCQLYVTSCSELEATGSSSFRPSGAMTPEILSTCASPAAWSAPPISWSESRVRQPCWRAYAIA
eukprot:6924648-Prymnesium_polylepis.1